MHDALHSQCSLPELNLALKLGRSRNLVGLAIAKGLSLLVVDAYKNSRVVRRVRTREADGLASSV